MGNLPKTSSTGSRNFEEAMTQESWGGQKMGEERKKKTPWIKGSSWSRQRRN
jgi:hypothetical protein